MKIDHRWVDEEIDQWVYMTKTEHHYAPWTVHVGFGAANVVARLTRKVEAKAAVDTLRNAWRLHFDLLPPVLKRKRKKSAS